MKNNYFILYHGSSEVEPDEQFWFDTKNNFIKYLKNNFAAFPKKIYLFACDYRGHPDKTFDIYITDKFYLGVELISYAYHIHCDTFFIYEFNSFEDAYEMSLEMWEDHPLCYNDYDDLIARQILEN